MKRTFTVLKFGGPDSQGDIFLPGSVKEKAGKKVLLTKYFYNSFPISLVDEIKEQGNELKVTSEVPDILLDCTPAIGFQIIKSEPNEHGGRTIHEMKIMSVGLCTNNADSAILPIKDQQ